MIPTSLAGGRYELGDRLGLGGMALVVRGRDTALDRTVAVKLLADRAGGDPSLRERFLREARLAAGLTHPHVVAVYDSGEEDGQPYIVMECVDGVSLAERIHEDGPLPAAEAARLAREACAGIAHAHARGIVHRDVKPRNLLLRQDGTLKVADFGIARGGGSATLTEEGTVLGTAAYMAPEVVHGAPATPASDVYSLGAVLYELLTGRPPREAATISELALDEPPRPPGELVPALPPPLEEAVMRCLAREPEHRPSADELAQLLEAPTVPLALPARSRRLERTRPARRVWLLPLAGAAAVAAVAALAFGDGDPSGPAPVEPVPRGASPAEDARNLAAWLRRNAGAG